MIPALNVAFRMHQDTPAGFVPTCWLNYRRRAVRRKRARLRNDLSTIVSYSVAYGDSA
jgi:hypothetical protein